jgi:putative tricarboxylic transport membrane protein
MRKLGDIIGGFILLFVGVWAIIGGMKLHLGKFSEPQPGFFPFWGGVVLAVLSGVLLFQALSGRSKGTEAFGALWRPMIMIIGLIAYVAILNSLGYIIATIVLSIVLLRVLGTKRSWVLALAALIIAFGTYILFDRLLNVTLPGGVLGRFL